MPRYFFDLYDGERVTSDREGDGPSGIFNRPTQALHMRGEIAKGHARPHWPRSARLLATNQPDRDQRDISMTIRDESEQTLLKGTLALPVESTAAS